MLSELNAEEFVIHEIEKDLRIMPSSFSVCGSCFAGLRTRDVLAAAYHGRRLML